MLGGTLFPFIYLVSACFCTPLFFDLLLKEEKEEEEKKRGFIYTGFAKNSICHVKRVAMAKKCGNKPSKYEEKKSGEKKGPLKKQT